MKSAYHKCQFCDRVYFCECAKTHHRSHREPEYDCGTCVHRPEIVNTDNIPYGHAIYESLFRANNRGGEGNNGATRKYLWARR